jgi:hypothetical protein
MYAAEKNHFAFSVKLTNGDFVKKRNFTLLELMAALAVFMICLHLITTVIVQSHKAFAYNESRFTVSLVMENLLEELTPESSRIEEVKRILEDESLLNELEQKGISWSVEEVDGKADIQFFHKNKKIFSAELDLL